MSINFERVPGYIRREIEPPKKTVSRGASNASVRRIQEWLCFHHCRTSIDGKYGPATTDRVGFFQNSVGLPTNGRVNKATWDALVQPMKKALAEPVNVAGCSADLPLTAIAKQHLEQHPIEIGGPNEGPWVRLYCQGYDGPPWAWCAGFVTLIMQQAFFYKGESTPIKGSVSCDSLAAQAKAAGIFVPGRSLAKSKMSPETLGDISIFLKRRTATDWTHAGFAMATRGRPNALVFDTIEGNTNDEGSREGYEACSRTRGLGSGDYDFVVFD